MNTFQELKIFVEVVESGSISGAAERLQIAKSAVSRRLNALESRLQVQLLTRTTRRQNLTEAGEVFYERSLAVLAELEAAEEAVSDADSALRGTLRISAPQSYGLAHVAPAVLEFMAEYPDILIDLDLTDRLVDMTREGFDLAVRVGVLQDSTLRARRFSDVQIVVCASPAYISRMGMPGTPDELVHHHCIRYSRVPNIHVWRYRDRSQQAGQVRVPIRTLSTSGDFMREAAVAGFGLALMPNFLVDDALRNGSLVQVLKAYEWHEAAPGQGVHVVFPPSPRRSRRVRVFADFLAERLGGP